MAGRNKAEREDLMRLQDQLVDGPALPTQPEPPGVEIVPMAEMTDAQVDKLVRLPPAATEPSAMVALVAASAAELSPLAQAETPTREVVLAHAQGFFGRALIACNHRIRAITTKDGRPMPMRSRKARRELDDAEWSREMNRLSVVAATATAGYKTVTAMSEGVVDQDSEFSDLLRQLTRDMGELARAARSHVAPIPVVTVDVTADDDE